MRISSIAFANLRRRKGKAVFLAAGSAIGIGTVIALLALSSSIRSEIGTQLDQFGANIVVLPRSDSLALTYGGVSVSSVSFDSRQLTEGDVRALQGIPYANRLSVVAPKVLGAVEVGGRQVVMAGVDFESEIKLRRWWRIAGTKPSGDEEVLVGYDAARALALITADGKAVKNPTKTLADRDTTAMDGGQPQRHAMAMGGTDHGHHSASGGPDIQLVKHMLKIGDREFHVAGVIAPTAGPEDRMIFGSLRTARSLLNKPGAVSLIEVSALCKDCPVDDIVNQIAARLPHAKPSAVQQAVRAREETVDRLTQFSVAVSGVVLLIGALLIFTSMTGAVVERTRELGVLRAIGFRKRHIIHSLVIEVAVISVVGGLVGWAVGTLTGWAVLPYFAETETAFAPRLSYVPIAIGGALVIGAASALYPIIRASRLDPAEAVRAV